MGKPAGIPDTEPDRDGDGIDFQSDHFGNGGRLGSVSSVFLPDKHPDTGFHYRSVYFPDAGVEEPGAYLYYLTGIYRADIVLYQ